MNWNDLPIDVQNELSDPFYTGKTHGKKPTYQAGCRGPLCTKNERDTKRAAYRRRKGGVVQMRKPRDSQIRDPQLAMIQAWHQSLGVDGERRAG